ncbi:1-aminocyclopropane-1-carboxylate oxidase homolog 4-like [Lolium rigidum]|uniref:1-aminocyclopropane-1-carboxylate oxidase homolog 4-like n=1 Tax=Lolium rigidum TaxID=89674 RepID=UPI001F5DC23A|nr:1-aminocyclopropane-1-carboxylate oxidase homolog 4-like [Lolium rigidum]
MAANDDYDAAAALAKYHESGGGVRGLVESGITFVPPFFQFLAPGCPGSTAAPKKTTQFAIPTVDLSLPRTAIVSLVGEAARTCGIFYVTNHGVDADAAVSAVRTFHELPLASRSPLYTLTPVGGVTYSTQPRPPGQGAEPILPWRDCLKFLSPKPNFGRIPEVCRNALLEHRQRMEEFGKKMAAMLLEALGVGPEWLGVEAWIMACHYYPPCPEPERVVGCGEHTDPCVLTVLAQDEVGGLQIRLDGGGNDGAWMDVPPVPGALLVNIGDVLKLVSNDEYKSVMHKVRIKSDRDARISIATLFNPPKRGDSDLFGPLPELVTAEKPARYRSFTMTEFLKSCAEFGHGRSSTDRLRVADTM